VRLEKIISGGQTGADRAALDVAAERGLQAGGWVPRGRLAEDGPIPAQYAGLVETESSDPAVRTLRNVRDSDATLIVSHGPPAGGSLLTLEAARRIRKPMLHLDVQQLAPDKAAALLLEWLAAVDPAVLNVAGPRAGEDVTIFAAVAALLRAVLPSQ
jgi:hypothetical protein